jgi:hypothetical protein
MAQAQSRLSPEAASVERISAELVEKLKAKGCRSDHPVAPLASVPVRREPVFTSACRRPTTTPTHRSVQPTSSGCCRRRTSSGITAG